MQHHLWKEPTCPAQFLFEGPSELRQSDLLPAERLWRWPPPVSSLLPLFLLVGPGKSSEPPGR